MAALRRTPVAGLPAYGPGVIYLLGAPLQLSRRFRTRHYGVHRRLGRVLLGAALLSGVFALVFGVPFAFGGFWQAAATVVLTADPTAPTSRRHNCHNVRKEPR